MRVMQAFTNAMVTDRRRIAVDPSSVGKARWPLNRKSILLRDCLLIAQGMRRLETAQTGKR